MIVGDSIIMPRLSSTLATTRSITRNGRKIMNPIWNAVSSSDVTKAGSRIEKGTSEGLAKVPPPAMSVNIIRFASRVCSSMKA